MPVLFPVILLTALLSAYILDSFRTGRAQSHTQPTPSYSCTCLNILPANPIFFFKVVFKKCNVANLQKSNRVRSFANCFLFSLSSSSIDRIRNRLTAKLFGIRLDPSSLQTLGTKLLFRLHTPHLY